MTKQKGDVTVKNVERTRVQDSNAPILSKPREHVEKTISTTDKSTSVETTGVGGKRPRQESNAPLMEAQGRRQYCMVEMRSTTTGMHLDTFPTLSAAEKATKISQTLIEQGK
jgi:hypothetical protein